MFLKIKKERGLMPGDIVHIKGFFNGQITHKYGHPRYNLNRQRKHIEIKNVKFFVVLSQKFLGNPDICIVLPIESISSGYDGGNIVQLMNIKSYKKYVKPVLIETKALIRTNKEKLQQEYNLDSRYHDVLKNYLDEIGGRIPEMAFRNG